MAARTFPTPRMQASRPARAGSGVTRNHAVRSLVLCAVLLLPLATAARADDGAFLPSAVRTVSTVPANGDQNPYGVAFVPARFPSGGALNPGDILVSNFNNQANLQGTGTTIVQVPKSGAPSVFFQGQSGLGLSTALAVFQQGFVVVGNFPTTDGSCATAQAGSLLVIDKNGQLVSTLTDPSINGPWDMTVFEEGRGRKALAFVSNALSGTVTRLNLAIDPTGVTIEKATQVASGFMHQCDPSALVDAPTGLVYDPSKDLLYVASTADNAIYEIHHAGTTTRDQGTGKVLFNDATHLHGPIAMILAPNGDLLVSNNDAINPDPNQTSEIVEFTTTGRFVKQLSVDPSAGGAFGMAIATSRTSAQFAAVDDVTGTLMIWTIPLP